MSLLVREHPGAGASLAECVKDFGLRVALTQTTVSNSSPTAKVTEVELGRCRKHKLQQPQRINRQAGLGALPSELAKALVSI